MISHLRGSVTYIGVNYIILEVNDIGYEIHLSSRNLNKINKDEEIKILTYLYLRDELLQLYGFVESLELDLFKLLIGISGVGPRAALAILSDCSCEEIILNINSENADFFTQVPGIGRKTSQRIILDLKDKMQKTLKLPESVDIGVDISDDIFEQTISGLISLGYSVREVQGIVREAALEADNAITVEKLLNIVLKKLATHKKVK